jgi:hypothetical protein
VQEQRWRKDGQAMLLSERQGRSIGNFKGIKLVGK